MKTRAFLLASAACLSSLAAIAACANDEDPVTVGVTPPPTQTLPEAGPADAGVDAAPFVCATGQLCLAGPFEPGTPGGALDLRTRIGVIRGRSASDVWAVGAQGAVAHFDGTTWTRLDPSTKSTFVALWLRDSGEVVLPQLLDAFVHDVTLPPVDAGTDAGDAGDAGDAAVDAGVDAGPIAAWAENPLTLPAGVSSLDDALLQSAWTAPGATWLWLTTIETPFLSDTPSGLWRIRYGATGQLELNSPIASGTCGVMPCQKMVGIHGSSADDLWAVGYTGSIVHVTAAQSDNPVITAFDSQTWAGLNAVWAASATEAWAVGGAGVIRHYTGAPASWDIVEDVPTIENLNAVWGSSATDVWAVGDHSTVLHYDGKSWSLMSVGGYEPRIPDLYTVWTAAPGHVWIGGDGAFLSIGGQP